MKHVKLFEDFINESKYNGNIAGDASEYIAKELSHYVKGIIDQPNDKQTFFHLKDKSYKSKVIKALKDLYGLEAYDGGTEFSPSPTIKFDNDQILESTVNEAKQIDNAYTFDNLEDYRKAVKALRDAGFYRSGSGNPPKGDEPGTYVEDERWLDLRINGGEKEAAKLIKKTKTNYKSEYKGGRGYTVHNHGGYLD